MKEIIFKFKECTQRDNGSFRVLFTVKNEKYGFTSTVYANYEEAWDKDLVVPLADIKNGKVTIEKRASGYTWLNGI